MPKRYYHLIGILIFVIILSRIDFYKLYNIFLQINIFKFFLINLLIAPIVFLKSLRWKYILRWQSIYYSTKETILIYLAGIYAGLVTPGRVGEAFKTLYLQNEKGAPLGKGLATIFIDRLCDLYLLLSFGLLGLWKFFPGINNWPALIIIIFLLLVAPFILLNRTLITRLAKYLQYLSIFRKYKIGLKFHYHEFYNSVRTIKIGQILLLLAITLISALLYFWQCRWLILLAGIKIPFLTIVFFISIVNVVNLLPITVAGIGTREATLIYLFSLIGLRAEEAICVSFLMFVSFYVLTGALGALSWQMKLKEEK